MKFRAPGIPSSSQHIRQVYELTQPLDDLSGRLEHILGRIRIPGRILLECSVSCKPTAEHASFYCSRISRVKTGIPSTAALVRDR